MCGARSAEEEALRQDHSEKQFLTLPFAVHRSPLPFTVAVHRSPFAVRRCRSPSVRPWTFSTWRLVRPIRDPRPRAAGETRQHESYTLSFLWIAANELPLREELIPFLIARSGRALDDFVRWVAKRRPSSWVLRMVQIIPMSESLREEMLRYVPRTDEPEIRARQRHVAKILLDINPDLREEERKEGRKEGLEAGLQPLLHQFERRLGRVLRDEEHRTLSERLTKVGAHRLGDVVLDLAPEALAAWLANPDAI